MNIDTQIKLSKNFHHNNLILQILYHPHFDLYTINIHKINDNTNYDIFGIFETLQHATKKFNTIQL